MCLRMTHETHLLDATGLLCPLPVLKARKRLQGLPVGGRLTLLADDPAAVVDVISKGAAQSWQMDNRWETMVAGVFDFGFAVDWMRKDLAIALEEAQRNGAQLEVTALVDRFYAEVQEMGGYRWDTSSLIARLEHD